MQPLTRYWGMNLLSADPLGCRTNRRRWLTISKVDSSVDTHFRNLSSNFVSLFGTIADNLPVNWCHLIFTFSYASEKSLTSHISFDTRHCIQVSHAPVQYESWKSQTWANDRKSHQLSHSSPSFFEPSSWLLLRFHLSRLFIMLNDTGNWALICVHHISGYCVLCFSSWVKANDQFSNGQEGSWNKIMNMEQERRMQRSCLRCISD